MLDISYLYIFSFRSLNSETKNGDTITENDLVTRQYENLPYPEVSEKEISQEEQYYKNDDDTLMALFPGNTLETINHYLHQGSENFR